MPAPASRHDHTTPDLVVRIKRSADGAASLSCTRADGIVTWQRQPGSLGAVFPPHDLTQYAVETTLGYRHRFFGLVADGWDISDFGTPLPRGAARVVGRDPRGRHARAAILAPCPVPGRRLTLSSLLSTP